MKKAVLLPVFAGLVLLGAGLVAAGCKSGPELTQQQALALIQAKYDAQPAAPITINVNDLGMSEGLTAKYWAGVKKYPNGFWGDFQLTPDGKKVLTLAGGGDTIQWRPEQPKDPHYAISINTVATNHLKARDIGDVQDQAGGAKVAEFTEDVVFTGVPNALENIAHNPGNHLSAKRTATFVLTGGTWSVQSIN